MASRDKQDKLKELTDRLEQGIKEVYESEHYKDYLSLMSKFHSYSFRNSLLIMMQKPTATHVAGFNSWKNNFNRTVNKGEKGIQILAPSPYRIKVEMDKIDPISQKPVLDKTGKPVTEEVEITKPSFRPVYVFDVDQTSGEPLPQLITELSGSVSEYRAFLESLKSVSPFPVVFEDIKSGAKGYCDPVNQKIAIKDGMSEVQTIKTAIHEITHADLHADQRHLSLEERKDRRTKEVEAESVAFVVCSHYGIDTSHYSFGYVAGWSSDKELNELKSSLDTIQKQAAELIDRIDTRLHELLIEQPVHPMPDANLSIQDMEKYGYSFNDHDKMLPLGKEKAVELFDKDDPVHLLYSNNTEVHSYDRDELIEHLENGGIAGIELEDWENIIEFDDLKKWSKDTFEEVLKEQSAAPASEAAAIVLPERMDGEIDPLKEPVVTIRLSEHPAFHDRPKLPLSEASAIFEQLDRQQHEVRNQPGYEGFLYHKTNFEIEYQKDGELRKFSGRQDLGDGDGSLTSHIQKGAERSLNDDFMNSWHEQKGGHEQFVAEMRYVLDEFVPYLKMHEGLTDLEKMSQSMIIELSAIKEQGGTVTDLENRIAYHSDVLKYIQDARSELNTATGEYRLPEMPRLESYLAEAHAMEQYKEQVKAEIRQEALSAGLTVEDYTKNDYEVPAERTFTIYQLAPGEQNRFRRWESLESLQNQGEQPDFKNYNKVYSGVIDQSVTLENIYQEFNLNRPADFKGHSLSMSDVVVIESNYSEPTANYVDDIGFASIPEFAIQHLHQKHIEAGYYGHVDFLGSGGVVGETIYFKDKESFDKEISESHEVGRPISSHVFEEQKLAREQFDSVRFDNDIDLDKERNREQLGFKDNGKPLSMAERMAAAKERSAAQKQKNNTDKAKDKTKEREDKECSL